MNFEKGIKNNEDFWKQKDAKILQKCAKKIVFSISLKTLGEAGELCGQIQDEDGIQPLEALLFTLDEINRSDSESVIIKLKCTQSWTLICFQS